MKPPRFQYEAPRTLVDALDLLADGPEDTNILAGGQSLVPMLNMRLARPDLVVDLNRVQGLDGVEQDGRAGTIRIGAMVRQHVLETSPDTSPTSRYAPAGRWAGVWPMPTPPPSCPRR
jgi:carbon-monoxide dehydrogenase medium subunit